MNSAANAILHFDIELRDDVVFEGSVFFKVFLGGSIDNVANVEALDGFVFRTESAAVDTDDCFNESSVVFVSAVVSPLDGHVVNILLNI